MSGDCDKCGEHCVDCKCINWIRIKERLPEEHQLVLIKLNYLEPYICVARFMKNVTTLDGDYIDLFLAMIHPRFPMYWAFIDEHKKIGRITKNKVAYWAALPEYELDELDASTKTPKWIKNEMDKSQRKKT